MRRAALLMALAALSSCATTGQALAVSGTSLTALGAQAEATNAAFVALCRPPGAATLSVATCDGYRAFEARFKVGFHLARTSWDIAADKGTVPADWSDLVTQLAQFTTIALTVHPAAAPLPPEVP